MLIFLQIDESYKAYFKKCGDMMKYLEIFGKTKVCGTFKFDEEQELPGIEGKNNLPDSQNKFKYIAYWFA